MTKGKGIGVVTSVLSQHQSEMGKIAKLLKKDTKGKEKTPLQKMLKQLAKYLTIVALVISVSVPLLGLIRDTSQWRQLILTGKYLSKL